MAAALAVCSTKGGSGKTTLAFNLAERAVAAGLRVIVLDCDHQRASTGLAMTRLDELGDCWPVERCPVTLAGAQRVRSLAGGGEYDLALCDLPGSEGMMLGGFLLEMDLVLAPVGVGAIHVMAAANLLSLERSLTRRVPLVFVLNNFPPGRSRLEMVKEELAGRGGEVCPVGVRHRVAHMDTFDNGLGVCERLSGSAAAQDIEALWDWVSGRLELLAPAADRGAGRWPGRV